MEDLINSMEQINLENIKNTKKKPKINKIVDILNDRDSNQHFN